MFTGSAICSAPKIDRTWKNLEAFYIALIRPNLNKQCNLNVLTLFRNGQGVIQENNFGVGSGRLSKPNVTKGS